MANKTWLLYWHENGGIDCRPFDPEEIDPLELYLRIVNATGENYYDTEAFLVSIDDNGKMTAHEVWSPELDNKR